MRPLNLVIAGVGGQGVFSLTRVLQHLCLRARFPCQSSLYKGGAQRLGSVTSFVRITPSLDVEPPRLSADIPPGQLDLLIAIDPWEGLRHQALFGENTRIVINTSVTPLFIERFRSEAVRNPVALLESCVNDTIVCDYTGLASEQFNEKRMAGFVMARDGVRREWLPFDETDLVRTYLATLPCSSAAHDRLRAAEPMCPEV
jgi:Pyruvate/2-oxoacid:ferredoxin oxidoreductase gamma subunit